MVGFSNSQLDYWLASLPSAKKPAEDLGPADYREVMPLKLENAVNALRSTSTGKATHEPEETALVDLLADLMHFVDCHNANVMHGDYIDFDEALRIARGHYEAEKAGEL